MITVSVKLLRVQLIIHVTMHPFSNLNIADGRAVGGGWEGDLAEMSRIPE